MFQIEINPNEKLLDADYQPGNGPKNNTSDLADDVLNAIYKSILETTIQ